MEKLDAWVNSSLIDQLPADFISQVPEYYWDYSLITERLKYPEEVANEKPKNLSSKEWHDKLLIITPKEAAADGLLETLKYLKESGKFIGIGVFSQAAFNGHQKVLEYLLDTYPIFNPDKAYHAAAYGDHVNILQWMNARNLVDELQYIDEDVLAYLGNLETLKYILNMIGPGISSRIATYALLGNNLPVLRWAADSGVFPDMNLYSRIKLRAGDNMRSNLRAVGIDRDLREHELPYIDSAGQIAPGIREDILDWMEENGITLP